MKKPLPTYFLYFLTLVLPLPLAALNETEPNNSLATANVTFEDSINTGTVSSATDANDYWILLPEDDGTIRIYFTASNPSGPASDDFFLYVYNRNGVQIGAVFKYNIGIGSLTDSLAITCRQQDSIYVRITGNGTIDYSFRVSTELSGTRDAEPNNDFSSANFFLPTDTVKGRIGYTGTSADANDYFFSPLPEDGTLKVYLMYNNTSGSTASDFFTYLYNKNQVQIGSSIRYNQPLGISYDTLTIYCRENDTVFFRIHTTGCFSYEMHYEVLSSGSRDQEPNNTLATASFLPTLDTASGRIGYSSVSADQDDYYLTVLPLFGTFTYYIDYTNTSGSPNSNIFSYIYNKNGIQIGSRFSYNVGLGSGRDSITIPCRDLDTIYLRIRSNGCFSYEAYYKMLSPTSNDPEPNDNPGSAVFVNSTDTTEGRIGYSSVSTDGNDYFKTRLPDDGTLNLHFNYFNTSGSTASDFFVYVYNKNGVQIGTKFLYNQPLGSHTDTLTIHCRQADTVIYRIASTGCFSYSFYTDVVPSGLSDNEPNNGFASAQQVAFTGITQGRIGYNSIGADQDDYFTTTLPDDGTLKLYFDYTNTSGSTSSDFFVYVYNKNAVQIGTRFLYNRPLGMGSDSVVIHCRAADTVFYRIRSTGCFSYSFHSEVKTSRISDPEPNNSLAEANLVASTDTTIGRIGYASVGIDDDDYYMTILPDDGTLKLYYQFDNTSSSTGSDLFIYVYNKSGSQIGAQQKYNQPLGAGWDSLSIPCRAADTVYYRFKSYGCFSYSFFTEMKTSGVSDTGANNTAAQAGLIDLNQSMHGRVGYSSVTTDQDDYFRFYNPGYSNVTAFLEANNTGNSTGAGLFVYLYNSAGNQVYLYTYYNQPLSPWQDTLAFDCLPADTFYLRIRGSGCFSYKFDFEVKDQQPVATIEHARFGNTVAFIANTRVSDSIYWDFDDGTGTSKHYPKKEFAIGEFDVQLTAYNHHCNRIYRDTFHLSIAGIESYRPKQAAAAEMIGFFNLRIFGGGLDTLADVTLRQGSLTLKPQEIRSPSNAEMNVLFSFKGAEFGRYHLEIRLGNGDRFNFPNGFEIIKDEPGISLETNLLGPGRIRTNRWTDFTLEVSNKRKRLANGVVVCLALPRDLETNIEDIIYRKTGSLTIKGKTWDKLTIDREDFNQVYFDGQFDPDSDTVHYDYDEVFSYMDSLIHLDVDRLYNLPFVARLYPIYIPMIAGSSTYELHFKMRSPSSQSVKVASYTWPFTFRQNPVSSEALGWIHEGGMQAAALANAAPHPALQALGKSAGYVDIGSQVAFTEFFDWYYGVNNADAEFYTKQGMSLTAEVVGSKLPYGKTSDRATSKITSTRRSIKNTTENISITSQTLKNGRMDPGMRNRLLNDLDQMKSSLDKFGRRLDFAEQQKLIADAKNYFAGRGIDISNRMLQSLLFGDDEKDDNTNRPKKIEHDNLDFITSFDPNDIYGTSGPGRRNYIRKDRQLSYQVNFENVDTAKAPAQIVRVEVQLDTAFVDLNSVQLGHVGFGGKIYQVESERHTYFRDIDLRPAKDMIVRLNAHLDTITGSMIWQFTSLDTASSELISDPDDGFLPPNQTSPEGEGNIRFKLRLKEHLADKDSLGVFADIFFDENEPIRTNIWENVVDEKAPSSNIISGEVVEDTLIRLYYQGTDEGSGVESYYLHTRVDGKYWITETGLPLPPDGWVELSGSLGRTYDFYVEAQDSAGNREIKAARQPDRSFSLIPEPTAGTPFFTLYPNPSSGQVYLAPEGNYMEARIHIFDTYGSRVYEAQADLLRARPQVLNLGNLRNGIFFVRVESQEGNSSTEKLIIVN